MTPEQHTLAIKYLMERLQPEEQTELKSLLGEEDMPDLAEDGLKGRIAMDRLPERIKRQAVRRVSPDRSAETAAFHERFPGAAKIKVR